MKRKLSTRIICIILVVIFCGITIAADYICSRTNMYLTITNYLSGGFSVTDLDYKNETFENATEVGKSIADEGMVLLKNDGTLPLEGVTKVNLFGYTSAHLYIGGTGSGQTPAQEGDEECATLEQGFESVGIEINEELYNKYLNYEERHDFNSDKIFTIQEPEITDDSFYSDELWASYEEYSNIAILVLGRVSGEGVDIPEGYLTITDTELKLLNELEARFEYVYVIINSSNAMELGFLDDEEINGAIYMNLPGYDGAYSLAEIMTGEVNPSGRLADTFAYEHESAPSYYTATMESVKKYTDIEDNEKYNEGYYYTDYLESIYVGYRYYETAAEDGYIDYDAEVQYPFGYGLSYTTFSQEITKVEGEITENGADVISVTVNVTNTGSVAGKEVVQLYVSKPYYFGEIEKSSVDLIGFDKTESLEPGESQEITITFEVQDIASYDYNDANENGHYGYELDAGDYVISIRENSHDTIDSVTLNLATTCNYDTDTTTGATITNLFDDAAGDDETEELVYLSRADWEGTFPENNRVEDNYYNDANLIALQMSGGDKSETLNIADGRSASEAVLESTDDYVTEHYADDDPDIADTVTTGADNGLTIYDMVGVDYDDEQWDELLDQMTLDEMNSLIMNSAATSASSIDFDGLTSNDGPSGITASFAYNGGEASVVCYGYPNCTALACTWNTELAYAEGQAVGMEAQSVGVDVWYAPGANIHRTPYGGRNFEYFSEDGILAGQMSAQMTAGALSEGLLTMTKHVGLNETETCRNDNGLYCWCNEQALRELYLKPFEITIKEGGSKALMMSFCRIGSEWCGSSSALIDGLLRTEWGFDGFISTDAYCPMMQAHEYENVDSGLRAGTDTWLSIMVEGTPDSSSNYSMSVIREATHHILYASTYTYSIQNDVATGSSTPLWVYALIALNVVIFCGSATAIYFTFIHKKKGD